VSTDFWFSVAADHPHGGGRGKSKGNVHPVSPWGIPVSRCLTFTGVEFVGTDETRRRNQGTRRVTRGTPINGLLWSAREIRGKERGLKKGDCDHFCTFLIFISAFSLHSVRKVMRWVATRTVCRRHSVLPYTVKREPRNPRCIASLPNGRQKSKKMEPTLLPVEAERSFF
jgi:hypothetical protein